MAEKKNANELLAHQLGTYQTLRVVLACIGFALPFVVAGVGYFQCKAPPQWIAGSLSAYYHRTALFEFFTARDFFVGGLISAAACLYAYKGFSTKENVALNIAAVFAVGVALLPTAHGASALGQTTASQSCVVYMQPPFQDATIRPVLHALSAILFFLCLAYASIWRSRDTLRLLDDEGKRARYNRAYVAAGAFMALSPIIAAIVSSFDNSPNPIVIFLVEAFGVWAFCAYWVLKSREMRESKADGKVAAREVERTTVASQQPANALDRMLRKLQVGNADSVQRIVPVIRISPPEGAYSPAVPFKSPVSGG